MKRLALPLFMVALVVFATGWAFMFTSGGGNPFAGPTASPTPNPAVAIDQCTSGLVLSTANTGGTTGNIPLALTVSKNADGSNEGLILIHKGNTSDPNASSLTSMDTMGNTWTIDSAQTNNGHSMNADSSGCLNADYVTQSNAIGSDTVTANNPGTGLFNAAILCTLKNFAAYDVSSGTPYPNTGTATNALTGTVSPTVTTDTLLGASYVEAVNGNPGFVNASTNSTAALGTPTDCATPLCFTTSSVLFNVSELLGLTSETGVQGVTVGMQRSWAPQGNFCGGIIALSNAIATLSIAPLNSTISSGQTSQFSATATLASGGLRTVTSVATWSSSNSNVATVSSSGLVTAGSTAGTTLIFASYKGVSTSTMLTVTTTVAAFQQFAFGGQINGSYVAGTPAAGVSLFPRSMYGGGTNVASAIGTQHLTTSDAHEASLNLVEVGGPWVGFSNSECPSSCTGFNVNGTDGTICNDWHHWYINNGLTPYDNLFTSAGLGLVQRTDNYDGFCSSNYVNPSGGGHTIFYPQLQDVVNQNKQHAEFVYSVGLDEQQFGSSCTGADQQVCEIMKALRPIGTPGSWVPWGAETAQSDAAYSSWYTNPPTTNSSSSDLVVSESSDTGCNGAWPRCKHDFLDWYRRTTVNPARGPIPESIIAAVGSPFYYLKHTPPPYFFEPGVDFPTRGAANNITVSPALTMDGIWFPVAHGYQGVREYEYDGQANHWSGGSVCGAPTPSQICIGPNNPPGCFTCQTIDEGASSAADRTDPSFSPGGGGGQDRWYAESIANALIKQLEPYILQPMAGVQPDQAPNGGLCNDGNSTTCSGTFASSGYCAAPGDPIVCGAHQGNGGFLVVIENEPDTTGAAQSSLSYQFDPSPYFNSGQNTALMWRLTGSQDTTCNGVGNSISPGPGLSSAYSIANGLSGQYDCGNGDSLINGVSGWVPGSTFPSGMRAPTPSGCGAANGNGGTATFNAANGTCTLTLAPYEVDVFLYANSSTLGGTTIPGTSTLVGAGNSFAEAGLTCPLETNPQNPALAPYNADPTGVADSSVAIATALGTGDVMFSKPGTYLINLTGAATNLTTHGIVPPAGRKIECAAGVTLKETTSVPPAADAAMFFLDNGNNVICGCDMQGAQTGTPPYKILSVSSLWGQIGIAGPGTGDTIENNTFENTSGNSSIFTTLDYTGAGPNTLTVQYNTFSKIPYYSYVTDGPTTNATINNNYQTDGAIGNEWDSCGSGVGTTSVLFKDNESIATFGDCVQAQVITPPTQNCSANGFASGVPSTCNYAGTTFGGSVANANYCAGTASIPASYTNNGQVTNRAVYSNNILGANCSCNSGGAC